MFGLRQLQRKISGSLVVKSTFLTSYSCCVQQVYQDEQNKNYDIEEAKMSTFKANLKLKCFIFSHFLFLSLPSHHECPAVQFPLPPLPPLPPRPHRGQAAARSGETRQTPPASAVPPTGQTTQKPLSARLWRADHQGGPSLHLADVW